MFAARFFGPRFYADTYFARGSDTPPVGGGDGDSEQLWRKIIGFRMIGG